MYILPRSTAPAGWRGSVMWFFSACPVVNRVAYFLAPDDFWHGWDYEVSCNGVKDTMRRRAWEIACYNVTRARYAVGAALCRRFGHGKYLTSEGYGGPDSGYDAGECSRCGFSYHHTMY